MRSPPAGLSPVVSVSKMISRTGFLLPDALAQTSQDMLHLGLGVGESRSIVDDEMGALALVRIGHLALEDDVEELRPHPGPREHPAALHLLRRGDNDRRVEILLAAGLEQQR